MQRHFKGRLAIVITTFLSATTLVPASHARESGTATALVHARSIESFFKGRTVGRVEFGRFNQAVSYYNDPQGAKADGQTEFIQRVFSDHAQEWGEKVLSNAEAWREQVIEDARKNNWGEEKLPELKERLQVLPPEIQEREAIRSGALVPGVAVLKEGKPVWPNNTVKSLPKGTQTTVAHAIGTLKAWYHGEILGSAGAWQALQDAADGPVKHGPEGYTSLYGYFRGLATMTRLLGSPVNGQAFDASFQARSDDMRAIETAYHRTLKPSEAYVLQRVNDVLIPIPSDHKLAKQKVFGVDRTFDSLEDAQTIVHQLEQGHEPIVWLLKPSGLHAAVNHESHVHYKITRGARREVQP